MSDPNNQLTGDHSQIKRLFNQWSHHGGTEPGMETALAITGLLKIHTTLEEEFVYPVLMNIDEGLAKQSLREHAEAGEIVASIEAMPSDISHPNTGDQHATMSTPWAAFRRQWGFTSRRKRTSRSPSCWQIARPRTSRPWPTRCIGVVNSCSPWSIRAQPRHEQEFLAGTPHRSSSGQRSAQPAPGSLQCHER